MTQTPDPEEAQAAIEYCYAQGWSDGLPLVPASQPLVEAFLATTRTLMTFVACPGVGVAPSIGAARRIGTDGPTVVLLDADGAPLGQFRRA